MDNPKTYILAFVSAIVLLCLALWLTSSEEKQLITAEVISNTLTQSLDGQRRYLTVESDVLGLKRVAVPTNVQCSEGAIVTFSQATDSSLRATAHVYKLRMSLSCSRPNIPYYCEETKDDASTDHNR